jgi:sugar-specific transcriptional regulator TrmB
MVNLSSVGLSDTEAKCYTALLSKKDWRPALLAKEIKESRTNCYKLLDKLVANKLAERFDKDKKLHYRATNPTNLIQLVHDRRAAQEQQQQQLELDVQNLIGEYLKVNERAGVRYFQGKKDLKNIYQDQVETGEPIYFVHTLAGIDFYGYNGMHELRMLAVKAGIPRYALTPDTINATADWEKTDNKFLLTRTWMSNKDYTAPVEWGAYGDKIYIVSFGEEASGMIIESPQIAESFRQLFNLLDRGQRSQPGYNELPRLAQKRAKVD